MATRITSRQCSRKTAAGSQCKHSTNNTNGDCGRHAFKVDATAHIPERTAAETCYYDGSPIGPYGCTGDRKVHDAAVTRRITGAPDDPGDSNDTHMVEFACGRRVKYTADHVEAYKEYQIIIDHALDCIDCLSLRLDHDPDWLEDEVQAQDVTAGWKAVDDALDRLVATGHERLGLQDNLIKLQTKQRRNPTSVSDHALTKAQSAYDESLAESVRLDSAVDAAEVRWLNAYVALSGESPDQARARITSLSTSAYESKVCVVESAPDHNDGIADTRRTELLQLLNKQYRCMGGGGLTADELWSIREQVEFDHTNYVNAGEPCECGLRADHDCYKHAKVWENPRSYEPFGTCNICGSEIYAHRYDALGMSSAER